MNPMYGYQNTLENHGFDYVDISDDRSNMITTAEKKVK